MEVIGVEGRIEVCELSVSIGVRVVCTGTEAIRLAVNDVCVGGACDTSFALSEILVIPIGRDGEISGVSDFGSGFALELSCRKRRTVIEQDTVGWSVRLERNTGGG